MRVQIVSRAVTETKTVEVDPGKVVIELTENAAKALTAVLGGITNNACTELWSVFSTLTDTFPQRNRNGYRLTYGVGPNSGTTPKLVKD